MHNISRRFGEKTKTREVFGRFIQQIIIKRTTHELQIPHAVDRRATAPYRRQLEAGSESTSPSGLGAVPTAKPTSTYSAVVLTECTETDACGSYVGQLLCHPPPAVGGYETRGRLSLLGHVKGRDRLRRPSSEAVASAVLCCKVRERIHKLGVYSHGFHIA